MSGLRGRFERELERLDLEPGATLLAVSGGPDSLALLDLSARSPRLGPSVVGVVHIDHGIHPESATVRAAVERAAGGYGIAVSTFELGLGPGTSETTARRARYAAFEAAIGQAGARYVMLGHTADDQVETLLMRYLRGSGVAGLAGMRGRRGPFIRPILPFHRDELAAHLDEIGLEPWEDPANRDPRHLRSWIRHQLLPLIDGKLPSFRDDVLASRVDFETEIEAVDGLLEPLGVTPTADANGGSVARDSLKGYSSAEVKVLLRAIGRRFDLALGRAEVDRLQVLLEQGSSGQRVDLGRGAFGELAFDRVRLARGLAHLSVEAVELSGGEGSVRFGDVAVHWSQTAVPADPLERRGPVTWIGAGSSIRLRTWRPGDVIRPLRGRGSRLVVRCMQESRVARSRRPEWPIFESDGVVLWVPDVCRADARVPEPRSQATRIDVRAI